MAIEDVADKLAKRMRGFNHTAQFDFGGEGMLHVDATGADVVVTKGETDAEVTLETSLETFEKILAGTQDPNIAFMIGKLKVRGSMGLALKLNGMLED